MWNVPEYSVCISLSQSLGGGAGRLNSLLEIFTEKPETSK